jgi:hypothetical protein
MRARAVKILIAARVSIYYIIIIIIGNTISITRTFLTRFKLIFKIIKIYLYLNRNWVHNVDFDKSEY